MHPSIEVGDPETMAASDLRALYVLERLAHEEAYPEDPLQTEDAFVAALRSPRPHLHRRHLVFRQAGEPAGRAFLRWRLGPQNRHLARVDAQVAPQYRRQGVGRALVQAAAEHAQTDGRSLLQGWTSSRVAAGEAFCAALGAENRSVSHENRLDLGALDREQLKGWLAAAEAQTDYELLLVDSPTPPELLEAAAAISNVMNTAPRDDLDEEDETITAEALEAWDRSLLAAGQRQVRIYVRHRPSGRFAGLTEMGWQPEDPRVLQQGDTGVLPEHRGRGLAKWIKAAMLLKVVEEVPGARSVVTGNAQSNDAMLAINWALGFRPAGSWTTWQLETRKVL